MINIIQYSFQLNTATSNRTIALANGLLRNSSEDVRIISFIGASSDQLKDKCDFSFLNLSSHVPYFLSRRLKLFFSIFELIKVLKKEDTVIVIGKFWICYLLSFFQFNRLLFDITEYPFIGIKSSLGKYFINLCIYRFRKIFGVLVISEALRMLFINKYKFPESKVFIINMIVDVNKFLDTTPCFNFDTSNYIAYCGSLSNSKDGILDLIGSFKLIHEVFPKIKLMLIGDFPNHIEKKRCMEYIAEKELNGDIIFTGKVDSSKMISLINSASVLLLCRPNNIQALYGFATKVGEYLMTKKPVVLTRVGDFDKFLTHGESVMFAEPNDIEDFANCVIYLLNHQSEAIKIGLNGCEIAKRFFNSNIETKKIVQILYGE